MEVRRGLIQPHIKTYSGIKVLFDNAYYGSGNGKIDSFVTDDRFFIAGIYDNGATSSKRSYTINNNNDAGTLGVGIYLRLFNDLTANSVDNWIIRNRSLSTYGQFIVCSICKNNAANFSLYDNTNGRYVFKSKGI